MKRLRVQLVCHDTGYNVGWSFRRLLGEWGYPIEFINEEAYFGGLSNSLFHRALNKVICKPPTYWHFNRQVVKVADRFQPELIFFLKGPYVSPDTLAALRARTSAIIVNYCLDDFFSLNPKAVTSEMRRCIPLWDFIFTTKRYNVGELEAAGAKRAIFVRCGYDPVVHYPVLPTPEEQARWGSDVLFVGTFERERAEWLNALIDRVPCNLRVFGNRWGAVQSRSALFRRIEGRPLSGQEKRMAFASTKIGLAFLRKANRDTYTDRSFEIPACGTFMLAEGSDEHAIMFKEGQEIACFKTVDELIEKVTHYLGHEQERIEIARAGYKRVTADHHTYADRLTEILKHVGLA